MITDSHNISPIAKEALGIDAIVTQVRALGVIEGGVLLVHTSFRAVRPVEDGPSGFIAALRRALGPRGTLVMPSWTGDDDTPFDRATTPAAKDLGVVAETFRRLPAVVRSEHPFAFAALGPRAAQIVGGVMPLLPHGPDSPIARVHEADGQVLLAGVDHNANTTLHFAEALADVPYRRPKYCTVFRNGRPKRVDYLENDHCCARFALADEWLRRRGAQAEGLAGHAHARLFRARDAVAAAFTHLAQDPLCFLHPADAGCAECDEARASVAA